MSRIWAAGVTVVAAGAVGLAAFAASGFGDGAARSTEGITARFSTGSITGQGLERAPSHGLTNRHGTHAAGKSVETSRKRGAHLKLAYYIGVDFQTVPPGGAQLFEIRCPNHAEHPLTGGMFATAPGLVAVNSSQTNPQLGFPSRPRAWYQAVVNITATALTWKPFVSCGEAK